MPGGGGQTSTQTSTQTTSVSVSTNVAPISVAVSGDLFKPFSDLFLGVSKDVTETLRSAQRLNADLRRTASFTPTGTPIAAASSAPAPLLLIGAGALAAYLLLKT